MPFKPKPKYRGNRNAFKVHVQKDDVVQVMSGSYKGTVSKVLQVFPKTSTIIVEGVNMKTSISSLKLMASLDKLLPVSFRFTVPKFCCTPKRKRPLVALATPLRKMARR